MARDTNVGIPLRDIRIDRDNIVANLACNIGMIGQTLKRKGFSTERIDAVAQECRDFIVKKAGEITTDIFERDNIENVIIMLLFHNALREQRDLIKRVAKERGVSEEVVENECLAEMQTGREDDDLDDGAGGC